MASDDISPPFDPIQFLGTKEPIQPVRYELSITAGPSVTLHVRSFVMVEELGEPYQVQLDLLCKDLDAPTEELEGASCELFVDRRDPMRTVYGIIHEVEDLGAIQDQLLIRVRVAPALKLLEHEVDTRIFQGCDVKEILSEVLTASLSAYGREFDIETHIKGTYNKRDYCTQFRESNLAFCQRLMEEEGITFYFEPDEAKKVERLVLIDQNAGYVAPTLIEGDEIPIVSHRPDEAEVESIQSVSWSRRRVPNRVTSRGYNEKVPATLDEDTQSGEDEHNPSTRPVYLHGERRQITEDVHGDPMANSWTGEGLDQRATMAKQAFERYRSQHKILEGHSNVTVLSVGSVLPLGMHPRDDLDGQQFLVISIDHEGDAAENVLGAPSGRRSQYANSFRAIPIEHEFRPELRRSRPLVANSQTAIVIGPPGEEIYCDPLGRIKVKFHWDRLTQDERSSCWMRVAQPWAGPAWGSMFIPRVGMEVLVQFLDGNADRPIVVGSIYNGDNAPPYPLPAEKTKSVIKTSSSPGGGGYNELTFEDASGAEQIIVHAQKDYNETVENNHSTTVHNSQTVTIDVDHSLTIHGKQTIVVDKDQNETVTGNVELKVEGTRTQTITKQETIKLLDALEHSIDQTAKYTITGALTETFNAGRTTTISGNDKLTLSDGDQTIKISKGALSTDASTKIYFKQKGHSFTLADRADLRTASDFKITNGKVTVESNGGKLKLTGSSEISLVCGAASITLTSAGSVQIEGSKEAKLGTPGTSFVAEPKGASVSGAKISSTAIGIHEVKGAIVKIN